MSKKYMGYSFIVFLLLFMLVLNGCNKLPTSKKGATPSDTLTGTEGIVMNFLPNAPPDKIVADSDEVKIPIIVEIRNRGAFPGPEDLGLVWQSNTISISGYDPNLIGNWKIDGSEEQQESDRPQVKFQNKALDGKSIFNPEGGYDVAEFEGILNIEDIQIDKFKPSFLVTACYDYHTRVNPTICIDNNPFSLSKEEKVCVVEDQTFSSQGAPIAITKIEQEALKNSIQFRIYFENVGGGDVIKWDNGLTKCAEGNLEREDFDSIWIEAITVSGKEIGGGCKPVNSEGYVRLFDNKGFISCSMPKEEGAKNTYNAPMFIDLYYGYRSSISKSVEIVNIKG